MNLSTGVQGWYKLEAVSEDGTTRVLADWFPNLITDAGLNNMSNSSITYTYYCQVGTGNTPPSVTDTALVAKVASKTGALAAGSNVTKQTVSPHYFSINLKFRFDRGTVSGNLAEVGVGWATTGSLYSRALILDGSGNPTTVTVLSTEYLDVTYQLRMYPSESDFTGTIDLAGNTYNWTARSAYVNDFFNSRVFNGWFMPVYGTYSSYVQPQAAIAYSGSIGDITAGPTGSSANSTTRTITPYSNNSYEQEITVTFGTSAANYAGGIGSVLFYYGWGVYQVGFSPNIPKISGQTLTLKFKNNWARKSI